MKLAVTVYEAVNGIAVFEVIFFSKNSACRTSWAFSATDFGRTLLSFSLLFTLQTLDTPPHSNCSQHGGIINATITKKKKKTENVLAAKLDMQQVTGILATCREQCRSAEAV